MNNYRILSLQISNARTIEMVDITPHGDLIKIQGENGQGKTTVLDIITAIFTRTGLDDGIVRKGEESAIGVANIGDYVIKRIIRKDKTPAIEVRRISDGKKIEQNADEFIAEITGKNGKRPIALDISRIINMDSAERLSLLLECAGIDTNRLNELNVRHKELLDLRKNEKKTLEKCESAMKEVERFAMPVDEPPSTADLAKRLREINEKISAIRKLHDEKNKALDEIKRQQDIIKELEKKILEAKSLLNAAKEKHDLIEKQIVSSNENELREEEARISNQMSTADARREAYNNHKKYIEKKGEWQKQYHVVSKVEKDLESVIDEKKRLLESGNYPTPNLSVQDGEIYFKGTHWSQLSESERLKVALSIAKGLNPPLRVILIRDGNAFDDKSMEQIATWAKTNNFQIWIERVNSIPELGSDSIYIVEGRQLTEDEKIEIIRKKTGV